MIIACLGDSLTEGDYGVFGKRGIANVHEENYPYFLGEMLNAEVRNYGKCGYRAKMYLKYYLSGEVKLTDADIVIIMLGTNGGLVPDVENDENTAYIKLAELCRRDAPRAEIYLCTPPHATENKSYSNCGYAEQVEKAVLFVRKYAREGGFPLIDIASSGIFTAENESIMQPNDGLHFGKIGYETLARFIAGEII